MFSYSSELSHYDKGVEDSKVLQLTSTFNNKIRDKKSLKLSSSLNNYPLYI